MTDTPDTPDVDEPESPNVAELRDAAERGKAAQAEAEAARRELAFLKAGIDTDTGPGKLLFKSYDGAADKEAVLAAAAEYGITPQGNEPPPPPTVEIPAEEQAQARERAALAAGAETPAGEPKPDPHLVGLQAAQEAQAQGASRVDSFDHYVGRVFEAAYVEQDPRAIHVPVVKD